MSPDKTAKKVAIFHDKQWCRVLIKKIESRNKTGFEKPSANFDMKWELSIKK
tara:strand:+ start:855 stop:1010 length:156 start_codon:yes stop_codon:yes gene_type:complete